ncbi:MAG: 30S ribosomal protein S17 [Elusimicrobia bacterium]|nr:30S ribosomal protein S17 [Elusimicrobiota bacterium]
MTSKPTEACPEGSGSTGSPSRAESRDRRVEGRVLRPQRKVREGVVVSDRMAKTRVVVLEWQRRHPLYGKVVRRKTYCYVHDEKSQSRVGDRVRIMETRPLSRLKRWRLVEILGKPR